MKIAYCIGALIGKGGTEKVLANKTDYFIRNFGYKIHIITEDQKNKPFTYDYNKDIVYHDVNVASLNKKVIKGVTFFKNVLKLRKIYSELFDKIQPDVIVVCERGYHDYVIPFTKNNIPKVREFHFAKAAVKEHAKLLPTLKSNWLHRFKYGLLFNMFDRYDYLALLTNSDQRSGGYKTNTIVIPNMMEGNIPTVDIGKKKKKVITVGSMHDKRKSFEVQISLWKKIILNHPDWVLDIYGDGVEKNSLQKLVIKLGLQENVMLHGNSNSMPKNYSESSIFLFTSVAEGLPMVLIEALSYGVPCVSYDCPTGPSDIITNNEDGYVVKQGDVSSLEKRLIELIDNEELRNKMAINAINNAKRFSPENIANKWNDFFNKIIDHEN